MKPESDVSALAEAAQPRNDADDRGCAPLSLTDWMREHQERFEAQAARRLPAATRDPQRLHRAMRYAVLGGGKRIRPMLVYAAGELAQAKLAALDHVALAVEYVHVYSLVHDDLPCMDNDVLRRGKPTVHVAFDEATAMLAGDALQAEAFRILAEAPLDAARRLDLVQELACAAGTDGMCGGQAIDLDAAGRILEASRLEQMHRMKTGALLRASILMGARAGGRLETPILVALEHYAQAVGLAFQIVDDILDVEADSAQLGKTAGKDQAQAKATYVSVLGLAVAKERAAQLRQAASIALGEMGLAKERTVRLLQLAEMIVTRRS
ncbi:MAG TPA: farnesyl diphosphate synthase [Burkholderiaceae bacterium]|nr:farnesyl diphosphate synthase [Burkholderiaceae bacterium]